jgi:hypothetical protein
MQGACHLSQEWPSWSTDGHARPLTSDRERIAHLRRTRVVRERAGLAQICA